MHSLLQIQGYNLIFGVTWLVDSLFALRLFQCAIGYLVNELSDDCKALFLLFG